jgi:hypothetical protein
VPTADWPGETVRRWKTVGKSRCRVDLHSLVVSVAVWGIVCGLYALDGHPVRGVLGLLLLATCARGTHPRRRASQRPGANSERSG